MQEAVQESESISAIETYGSATYPQHCPGATQTSGSICVSIGSGVPKSGEFGKAGNPQTLGITDDGGFGGGGYYGGTSYSYSYGGSGGSSFISGYEGCNAIKGPTDLTPTNQPNHYSEIVFSHPEMIPGNSSTPLPNGSFGTYFDEHGIFKITLLTVASMDRYLHAFHLHLFFIFSLFSQSE